MIFRFSALSGATFLLLLILLVQACRTGTPDNGTIDAFLAPEMVPVEDQHLVVVPEAELNVEVHEETMPTLVSSGDAVSMTLEQTMVETDPSSPSELPSDAPGVAPETGLAPEAMPPKAGGAQRENTAQDKKVAIAEARAWKTGRSRQNRRIDVWQYGPRHGARALLLIGGIHGKFEGNTVELMKAYRTAFTTEAPAIPVYVLENLNPDAFAVPPGPKGTVPMRFSSNLVDLNRNFPTPSWARDVHYRNGEVLRNGGGQYPLSEPETRFLVQVIKDIKALHPDIHIVNYHSYVYQAGEKGTVQPAYGAGTASLGAESLAQAMARIYSRASGLSLLPTWTAYPVPGEFLNWCGLNGLVAIDIELSNTASIVRLLPDGLTHLARNLAGVKALVGALTVR